MDLKLKGKVVLVTGGSKGIGLACARVFALEGAKVAIAARNPDTLHAAAQNLRAEGLTVHAQCIDLRDIAALHEGIGHVETALGGIDILVNSAGSARHHAPDSTDFERWTMGMRDKYLPYVQAMDAVIPRMAACGGGVVVNIVGTGGKVANITHIPGGAANAALILASAAFAKAWGAKGVRVNVINPGTTETDRLIGQLCVKAETSGKSIEEVRAQALARVPLGRYGTPEDVASMAVFLASARASYVSGAVIAVDGAASATP